MEKIVVDEGWRHLYPRRWRCRCHALLVLDLPFGAQALIGGLFVSLDLLHGLRDA